MRVSRSVVTTSPLVRPGSPWAQRILGWFGWRAEITTPPAPRCVVIMYPHTSNWDFILGLLARAAVGLRAQWVGKDSLFRFPFGSLMRALGGMPVDRSQRTGLTAQLAAELTRHEALCLALAPEGTRARTRHWRSGFYHVALAAGVPVGLGYIDYGRRVVGITRWHTMTGDVQRDLATLREYYADKKAKFPEQASDITFAPAAER